MYLDSPFRQTMHDLRKYRQEISTGNTIALKQTEGPYRLLWRSTTHPLPVLSDAVLVFFRTDGMIWRFEGRTGGEVSVRIVWRIVINEESARLSPVTLTVLSPSYEPRPEESFQGRFGTHFWIRSQVDTQLHCKEYNSTISTLSHNRTYVPSFISR